MSLIIQYIATVDETTGLIKSLQLTGGLSSAPAEGPIENSEPPELIIHLKTSDEEGWAGYDQGQIIEQFWWGGEEWQKRGSRPGDFYFWNVVDKTWDFNEEEFLKVLRYERDYRLTKCDWTQAADCQLEEVDKVRWRNYRQELRDIPNRFGDAKTLEQVGWPPPPDGRNIEFLSIL